MGRYRFAAKMIYRNVRKAQEEQDRIELKGLVSGETITGFSSDRVQSFGQMKLLVDAFNGARLATAFVKENVAVQLFPKGLEIDHLVFNIHEGRTDALVGQVTCRNLTVSDSKPLAFKVPTVRHDKTTGKYTPGTADADSKLHLVTFDIRSSDNDFVIQHV